MAARRGALIRRPEVLEQLASCGSLFFDKTGTLTAADLELSRVLSVGERRELELVGGALAQVSSHPLARSLSKAPSSDCDAGPRDIIRHEVDGLLVPVGDVACLATALQRLMGDDGLRHRMAGCAITVRERFSLEKIAGMWEVLFAKTMNEHKGNF